MAPWTIPALSFGFMVVTYLGAITFAVGRLFERVRRLDESSKRDDSTHDDVVRLKTQMEMLEKTIAKLDGSVTGLSHQLSTLMISGPGKAWQLGHAAE